MDAIFPTNVETMATQVPTNGTPSHPIESCHELHEGLSKREGGKSWESPILAVVGSPCDGMTSFLEAARVRHADIRRYDRFDDLLDKMASMAVGCVLSDWQTPDGNGFYLLRELMRRRSPLLSVFVADQVPASHVSRAMSHGVHGFLDRPAVLEDLVNATAEAVTASQELAQRCQEVASLASRVTLLTENERLVLQMAIDGVPNKTIAGRLDIALRTVELRRQSIFRKMACTSLCELVQQVVRGREWARILDKRFQASRQEGPPSSIQMI